MKRRNAAELNLNNVTRTLSTKLFSSLRTWFKIFAQFAKTFARTGCNHSKGSHIWNIPAQSKISAFSFFRLLGLDTHPQLGSQQWVRERRAWKLPWSLQLQELCFQSQVRVIKISLRGNGIHPTAILRAFLHIIYVAQKHEEIDTYICKIIPNRITRGFILVGLLLWQNLMEHILLKKGTTHARKRHKHKGYIKFSILVFSGNLHNIFSTIFPVSQFLRKNNNSDAYQDSKIFSWLIIHPYLYTGHAALMENI